MERLIMKKVFISQPMKGKTKDEIVKERALAVHFLQSLGYEIIDSVFDFEDEENVKTKRLFYLAKSLELMAREADLVVFLPKHEYAEGCMLEKQACLTYGIPIEYLYVTDGVVYLQ